LVLSTVLLKEKLPPRRAFGALVIVIVLALIAIVVLRQRFGRYRSIPRIQIGRVSTLSQVMLAS
jgi:drug/metabolite transporter (DMT)-like permease